MTVLETLKEARAKIADESRWYQGGIGRKRTGQTYRLCAGAAVCDSGAPWPSRKKVWSALAEQMGGDIPVFNDTHTHAEVLAAFDAAIAKAKQAAH